MKITKEEHEQLVNNLEFTTHGYQYTIMYITRIHAQMDFLLGKMIKLSGELFSKQEVSETIEAFSVKTICDWEWYAERMICECLNQDTTQLAKELDLKLPKQITIDECTAYLNGLGYFDLKNIGNLVSVGKKVLIPSKNPFLHISKEVKSYINDFYVFRNFVAHKSNKSKRTLLRVYKKYDQNEFTEVGQFLSQSYDNNKSIRLQDFSAAFWLAAFNIMEFLYPQSYEWVMQGEKGYSEEKHMRLHYLMHLSPNQPFGVKGN